VYPADVYGCGYYRLIWPAKALRDQGHDIQIIYPSERSRHFQGSLDVDGNMVNVSVPADAEVIVLQRITHKYLIDAIKILRKRGIAVVIDIDDDLASIDPSNPAFMQLHKRYGENPEHNWMNAQKACEIASYVTVSTDALLPRYAPHGRGAVIRNHVPRRYLDVSHEDSTVISWAGSTHSHPRDLDVVGIGVASLMDETTYRQIGPVDGIREALRLPFEPEATGPKEILREWPETLATIGIGIAPLADTRFNAAKSWLKPLEYSALGVPWVASPRSEYKRLHDMFGIGLLAEKPKHWTRELRKLVRDDALRKELSQRGREAAAQLTIEGNAWRWAEAWQAAYNIENR